MKATKKIRINIAFLVVALLTLSGVFAQTTAASGGTQVRITQVDASRFPQVTVYISVTDASGEPVSVDPSRFTLSENGAPIKIESAQSINAGAASVGSNRAETTLLAMDVSGSMNEAGKLEAAKGAARAYVNQLAPGDKVGLLAFNTQVNSMVPVTADRQAVLSAINNLKAGDYTAMYDALVHGVERLNDIPGRKSIIVLTDGLDNRSKSTADGVIEQIGPGGVTISVIGLGEPSQGTATMAGIDEAGLKSLAQRAGGFYAYVQDANGLRQVYERYGRILQNEYALTYHSPSTLRDGLSRALTVTLVDRVGSSAATEGTYNPGGVVPEVAQRNPWPIFLVGLAILIALLLIPGVVTRLGGTLPRALAHKGRVRLAKPAAGSAPKSVAQRAGSAFQNVLDAIARQKKPARVPNRPSSRVRLK